MRREAVGRRGPARQTRARRNEAEEQAVPVSTAAEPEPAEAELRELEEPDTGTKENGVGEATRGQSVQPRVIDFEQILHNSNLVELDNNMSNSNVINGCNNQTLDRSGCGGNLLDSQNNLDSHAMRCYDDSIFIHVPEAIRLRIWSGQYVNLALLLKGAPELEDICSGGTVHLSEEGRLESRPNNKACKDTIPNIDKWTDAFIIFMSIMLVNNVNLAPELLQYMHNIRDCARRQRGYAWRDYDEQFRMRQASKPMPWDSIHNELWWRCVQVKDDLSVSQVRSVGASSGICREYNKGFCGFRNCRFVHSCLSCGGRHSLRTCGGGSSSSFPAPGSNTTNSGQDYGHRTFRGSQSRRGVGFRSARYQPYPRRR